MSSLLASSSFIEPNWPAPANVVAYCTTRTGGNSRAPYDSFNLAKHVGDDATTVDANRQLLPNFENTFWLKQTHSAKCIDLSLHQVASFAHDELEADASYTSKSHQVCAIMTADCMPILMCDTQGTQVAAVHAGWRGLAEGIVEQGISQFLCAPEDILVWIGPAISQYFFEVGEEVKHAFSAHSDCIAAHHEPQKYLLDMPGIAKAKLQALGVTQVFGGEYCTYRQRPQFYSHRRSSHENKQRDANGIASTLITGRMVSGIYFR